MSDMAARGSPQLATEKKNSIASSLRNAMAKGAIQAVCLFMFEIFSKKCMGKVKSVHIINLHQVMTMLKLKININLPQL